MSEDISLPLEGLVKDQFYNRQITIYQKKKGYRFSVDAPLLADFLPECSGENALEIGPGSGIISMLTLFHNKFRNIEAVEIQKDFAVISELNCRENGFDGRFQVNNEDFCREWLKYRGVTHIFSNPPFMPVAGRVSPNEEIAIAKHEVKIDLNQLINKTRDILSENGNLYLVLPWSRYRELLKLAEEVGYSVNRVRRVINEADSGEPVRFLIQLSTYSTVQIEEEPLILYKSSGIYSEEAEQIFAGVKR